MQIARTASPLPATLVDALRRNAAAGGAFPGVGGAAPGAGGLGAMGGVGGLDGGPSAPASFGGALDQALRAVSASQNEATRLAEGFVRDPSQVSLEAGMVAMQKAQIGFQSALHVRNRLVSAYSDIMNMPV